jgi:hypothetical protein
MERPVTWKNAFRDLETELCDARNMARITAFYIADDCTDPECSPSLSVIPRVLWRTFTRSGPRFLTSWPR